MRAGRVLRQLIMDRIIDQVPALGGRVYDKAVEAAETPYVTMGPSFWVDDVAECVLAREVTIQIDVWDVVSNKGACEELTDDIATAVRGWADTALLTMMPLRVSLARVMDDPDGKHVHGMVQIEAMVEDG